MRNKTIGAITIAIIGLLVLGYCYLLYKVFTIFGLWTLIWTGIVSLFSGSILMLLATSKTVEGDSVKYNPKEWPKLLSFIISLAVGYYLFTLIDINNIDTVDYYFAIAYLITLTLIPIIIGLFRLLRDRNDELIITKTTISYRDNSNFETVEIAKVSKCEKYNGGYRLILKDEETFDIPFKKMGFNALDQISAINGILDAIGNNQLSNNGNLQGKQTDNNESSQEE